PVRRSFLEVDPARVVTAVVLLDRRAAAGDLVGELRRREDLLRGQDVLADDPPALAHADRRARREKRSPLVARNALTQEAEVLVRLATALDLGSGELVGVGCIDAA